MWWLITSWRSWERHTEFVFLLLDSLYLAGLIMHAWFWHVLQIWHWIDTRDFLLLVVFDIHRCLCHVWRCMMNPRRSDSATILLDGWVWCVVTNHQLEILRTPHRLCCLATRFTVSCRINHARLVLTCPANLTLGWNQRRLAARCDWYTPMPLKCLAVHDEPEEVRQCHHPFRRMGMVCGD